MEKDTQKDPLIALIYAFLFTGLGQIYSRRIKWGLLCMLIHVFLILTIITYLLIDELSILNIVIMMSLLTLFNVYVLLDAFYGIKIIELKRSLSKKTVLIFLVFLTASFNLNTLIVDYARRNIASIVKIATDSMNPILERGDRVLLNKVLYKKGFPQRGDIIVFNNPYDLNKEYIRRIIALEKETVEIREELIYINDKLTNNPKILNNRYYNLGPFCRKTEIIRVPPEHYFVLGDNSAESNDGRYWGYLDKKYIKGKATKIIFPFNRAQGIF